MPLRKLLVLAAIAGIVGSATACADVTGPQENQKAETGFCAVTGSGQTCIN